MFWLSPQGCLARLARQLSVARSVADTSLVDNSERDEIAKFETIVEKRIDAP